MTLQALRVRIGDDSFGTLLHRWFSTYRGGTASTADLTDLAEQVSGRDVDTFFQTWLYKTTKPIATPAAAAAAVAADGERI
jgi:aminopeptidase N